MENTNQKELPQELAKITLRVEEVANHYEEGLIGGVRTYLTLKNAKSYMVASTKTGLKVIENGEVVYSAKHKLSLLDITYIPHLNCYLLYDEQKKSTERTLMTNLLILSWRFTSR